MNGKNSGGATYFNDYDKGYGDEDAQNEWEGKYPWISCLSGYSRLSPSPARDRNQDSLVALIIAQNHFPFGEYYVLSNLQYL